jgi:type I restriction enzyme S subunit
VNPSLGDARYLSMILRALGLSGFLEAFAWSVRQRSVDYRNWSVFGKLPITLPSLDVQRALVLEVDAQHARIDDAIVTAERGIVLARERRAALISAAVTGQLEVAA